MTNKPKPQQPVPDVTQHDVLRIVQRDFPPEHTEEVLAKLNSYGCESFHTNPPRVRLAALKNAGGNIDRLHGEIHTACADYRDAIIAAEYPNYHREVRFDAPRPPAAELQRIYDLDWNQYSNWLHRSADETTKQ